jgi:plasmid stabilization system protein ParE
MDFQVFLSSQALSDLERIVAYIAFHNPVAAQRMGDKLLDAALSLHTMPERGRWCRNSESQSFVKLCFDHIASFIAFEFRRKVWKSFVSGTQQGAFRISHIWNEILRLG